MDKPHEGEKSRLSPKLLAGIILAVLFGVALCLRICLPYDQVFSGDWIKFTGPDAYYHMRLVDNLVHNFPRLISSDPYMIHPGAVLITRIHFFNWLLAGIIWVISFGSPTQHIIDVVGVYYPAVLGALIVIPVYFIGKEIFNRWVGVISAGLIAVLPGEFLGRSILGFTDHDVAGILFTTVTIMFLILAIKTARQRGLTFNHLKHGNWAIISKPIIYSVLAGVFVGLYRVTWPGALLFVFAVFVYFIIQFIIDHLRRQSTDYLCLVSVILFLIALLMYLPAAHEKLTLISLVIALVIPPVLSGISRLLTSRQIKPAYYPLAVVGLGLAGLYLFRIINRSIFNSMMETFGILFPKGVSLTTVEMQPLFFPSGEFSLKVAWGIFTTALPLSFIALGILIYLIIKHGSAEKSLLVVWSLVILLITLLTQRRFAAYLAVNVALLIGYLSWQLLSLAGFKEWVAKPVASLQRQERGKVKPKRRQKPGFRLNINQINMALAVIVVFFFVFFPNIKSAIDTAKQTPYAPSDAWCRSLSWLKANTPDPFGNPDYYYEFYEPSSPSTPDYSIMAWWDYGYWITRTAHRVPNTNPAQGGVYNVACCFLSQDEDSANKIRKKLGSKYIIIDYETVTKKFWAIATWAERDKSEFYDVYYQLQEGKLALIPLFHPEYYRSLSTRLYNFDGKAVTPQSSSVISYQEKVSREGELYKEVTSSKTFSSYEEAVAYVSSQKSANYKIVGIDPFVSPVPLEELKHYRLVHTSESQTMSPVGDMVPSVKIFEYIE